MKNRDLVIAGCVAGGLIGLGLAAYYTMKSEDKSKLEELLEELEAQTPIEPLRSPRVVEEPVLENKQEPAPMIISKAEILEVEEDVLPPETKEKPLEEPAIEENQEASIIAKAEPLIQDPVKEEGISFEPLAEGDQFPLRPGSHGDRVERLQVWLMRNYGWFGTVTKVFDAKTLEMVQKHLGLSELKEKVFNKYKMGKHVTEQIIIR